ncbi:VOC family protein [Micromonospora radicis]|uniref:Glyoxalase/bleomycin resistance/dioxygenase family protein n=1 Tax=Micromonospora radicis TaxID=1894971 RepID=A0A418MMM0_9ACTN|nr:VOC family protein [Micromonospora radicis]RIV29827.1 glyoxalase/bleomycin resistance/dioxygenase family protein [Micromonospora radicis]
MANGANRPIAPVRKLVAAVLGTVATFVILFGLGMTSWAIVALGVALVALSIALATVRAGGRTWVVGAGHVHSASEPPTQYAFGRCELQLVIDAPGLPPRSKKIIEPRVPVAKWPSLGQTLPIRVALDDPRHVRVLWDEVPTHAEGAELPPEFAAPMPPDEVLLGQEAPPWAGRSPEDDFHDPLADPLAEPLGAPVGGPLRDEPVEPVEPREPVRVRQRPGAPVVLEGTVVEQPTDHPLPRRATPAPRTPAEEHFAATGAPADDPATGVRLADPDERPADTVAPAAPAERVTGSAAGPADPPHTTDPLRTTDPLDPLDPLDLPLDDPEPAAGGSTDGAAGGGTDRAAAAGGAATRAEAAADRELDDAIFGFDPEAAEEAAPINGVGITLLVTELPRSLEFYRDRLGFGEVDRGTGNAVLASGATRLVLREVTGAQPINRRLVHVNLDVDDIQGAYERLRDSGVRFTYAPRIVNRGNKLEVWAAAFRDPDGHGIALTQWRERAEA